MELLTIRVMTLGGCLAARWEPAASWAHLHFRLEPQGWTSAGATVRSIVPLDMARPTDVERVANRTIRAMVRQAEDGDYLARLRAATRPLFPLPDEGPTAIT